MTKHFLIALAVLTVIGCSDHHEKMHAVDAVELAEKNALANAPVAEPMTFDDEGMPKAGETGTDSPSQIATDVATATDMAAENAVNTDADTAVTNTP